MLHVQQHATAAAATAATATAATAAATTAAATTITTITAKKLKITEKYYLSLFCQPILILYLSMTHFIFAEGKQIFFGPLLFPNNIRKREGVNFINIL